MDIKSIFFICLLIYTIYSIFKPEDTPHSPKAFIESIGTFILFIIGAIFFWIMISGDGQGIM